MSPSTHAIDRVKKMNIYARENVRWAWLVDPVVQTLEVFRLERGLWVRTSSWAGATSVRAEPFDAIELDLASLWER